MPFQAEVLFRQGWWVKTCWSEDEAWEVVRQRALAEEPTVNKAREWRVRPMELVECTAPTILFDEYCDQLWPSTAPKQSH